jgi:hypothetical protein
MALQEIAQGFYDINWTKVESCDIRESLKVRLLLSEIELLPPKEGLRLLMYVLESKALFIETIKIKVQENPYKKILELKDVNARIKLFHT